MSTRHIYWLIIFITLFIVGCTGSEEVIPLVTVEPPTVAAIFVQATPTLTPEPTATFTAAQIATASAVPPTPTPDPAFDEFGEEIDPEAIPENAFAIYVNPAEISHSIDPNIYGINSASAEIATELQLPVNRWGGNATTRYNWQNDTTNRAADWYFENIPFENENPESLPVGSTADKFISQNNETGTETLLTIPMIGWTAKDREIACGFSVAKYGEQADTDPFVEDCGNGLLPDGETPIVGNDPADTSVVIDEQFVQDWVAHLQSQFGSAGDSGVAYYSLDNEPMLWHETHRDVFPDPLGYDDLLDRTVRYASAIKTADPEAQVFGPVLWGWTAYSYSAQDVASGEEFWNEPPDRLAHEDLPLVIWYLKELQAQELIDGVRLLDYLDLHYYPAAPDVALSPAGDAETQALRLRSTRSLWDPNYVDESWIEQSVELIPLMRRWVDNFYPGTKTAVSEYNFGGVEDINGALTQADALGIFGREGLDFATFWEPPEEATAPLYYAFRMYRNYDGEYGRFGDTSVRAESEDDDLVSVFAAVNSETGQLTIMMINKQPEQEVTISLQIDEYPLTSEATLYQYTSDDLEAITATPQPISTETPSYITIPAYSINLLVLNPG